MHHPTQVLEELQKRIAGNPGRAAWLSLYIDLLSAQARVAAANGELEITPRAQLERLDAGLPLLSPAEFQADPAAFVGLCYEICTIVAAHRHDLATRIGDIRAWLDEGRATDVEWASLLCDGRTPQGEEDRLDQSLLAFILNQAVRPFLQSCARMLLPFVDETRWHRPNCPICGGSPDFAALAKPDGKRRLLCSRCDAEWSFWRTGCPFCGSEDPAEQEYSISEDCVYRLCICQACEGYLKTIDLRQVADERLLPVERLLTLPMDVAVLNVRQSNAKER